MNLKNKKNELRYLSALRSEKNGSVLVLDIEKYNRKMKVLFRQKQELINTFLFLNTAFSVIDKMFLREIANADLRRKHYVRFWFNDIVTVFAPVRCRMWFLPSTYAPNEDSDTELLKKITGIKN